MRPRPARPASPPNWPPPEPASPSWPRHRPPRRRRRTARPDRRGRPALTAVLHAAGAGQAVALQDTTLDQLAGLAAVKTAGTTHLDELTRELDLDAFVLFSSISAIWGSGLQPGYAAVNAYLDALAEQRRARGLAATSVSWGPWDGGGMSDNEGKAQMVRRGLRLLDPQLGIRALSQALDGEGPCSPSPSGLVGVRPRLTLRRRPLIESLPEVAQALADADGEADGADGGGSALASNCFRCPAEQEQLLVTWSGPRPPECSTTPRPTTSADRAQRPGRGLAHAVELRDRSAPRPGCGCPPRCSSTTPRPPPWPGICGRCWSRGVSRPAGSGRTRQAEACWSPPSRGRRHGRITPGWRRRRPERDHRRKPCGSRR
ncbi:KR domain-containing protein [Streptacidiphilus sp. 4-A2]|nr:KR domain-containing protein [Streptacidiphilus sp. 4-A2]